MDYTRSTTMTGSRTGSSRRRTGVWRSYSGMRSQLEDEEDYGCTSLLIPAVIVVIVVLFFVLLSTMTPQVPNGSATPGPPPAQPLSPLPSFVRLARWVFCLRPPILLVTLVLVIEWCPRLVADLGLRPRASLPVWPALVVLPVWRAYLGGHGGCCARVASRSFSGALKSPAKHWLMLRRC